MCSCWRDSDGLTVYVSNVPWDKHTEQNECNESIHEISHEANRPCVHSSKWIGTQHLYEKQCEVATSEQVKPHEGIVYLLIDRGRWKWNSGLLIGLEGGTSNWRRWKLSCKNMNSSHNVSCKPVARSLRWLHTYRHTFCMLTAITDVLEDFNTVKQHIAKVGHCADRTETIQECSSVSVVLSSACPVTNIFGKSHFFAC